MSTRRHKSGTTGQAFIPGEPTSITKRLYVYMNKTYPYLKWRVFEAVYYHGDSPQQHSKISPHHIHVHTVEPHYFQFPVRLCHYQGLNLCYKW